MDPLHENLLRFAPFGVGGPIVEALNGVADRDDEGRMIGGGFFPHLFVDAGLRFAGAVAQNGEVEVGGDEREPRTR